MVAVDASGFGATERLVAVLRDRGANLVEQAEGRWAAGWSDFDPLKSPRALHVSRVTGSIHFQT